MTNETKSTPGPWEVKRFDECLRIDSARMTTVAEVTHPDFHFTDFTPEECDANARLIAASPTMFEYVIMKALEGDKDAEKIARSAGWEAKGHVGKGE